METRPHHISDEEAQHWRDMAAKLKQISSLVSECQLKLILSLGITDPDNRALRAIDAIESAASGMSYLFTPQPEWTGGDSSDPRNHKIRPPHICK